MLLRNKKKRDSEKYFFYYSFDRYMTLLSDTKCVFNVLTVAESAASTASTTVQLFNFRKERKVPHLGYCTFEMNT